jgi:hypothetical protein
VGDEPVLVDQAEAREGLGERRASVGDEVLMAIPSNA